MSFSGSQLIPGRFPKFLPRNLTKFKGSTHWLLNFEAVKFALENEIAHEVNQSLASYFGPEESFFQILNFNPELNFPGGMRVKIPQKYYRDPSIVRHKEWMTKKGKGTTQLQFTKPTPPPPPHKTLQNEFDYQICSL